MPTLTLVQAEGLVVRTLTRCRTSIDNARSVARALVAAEADGLKGHGLSRVPTYAAQAKVRKIDGDGSAGRDAAAARPDRDRCGVRLCLSGASSSPKPRCRDAARRQGIAAAAIRHSSHCGAAGHPVERLANNGLVALMFANTPGAMAPWGGSKPVFGTNPIAFACPLPGRAPLVIDLSLSKVARGNIITAKQRGENIPEGWALDAQRQADHRSGRGAGRHDAADGRRQGHALALMVELLAAGLTGANFAAEASSYLDAEGAPSGTGQLIVAFDPAAFGSDAPARFGLLAQAIEAQAGARLPGMRRFKAREKAKAEGLTISDALMKEIERV